MGEVQPSLQEVSVCGLAGLHAVQPPHEPDEHVFELVCAVPLQAAPDGVDEGYTVRELDSALPCAALGLVQPAEQDVAVYVPDQAPQLPHEPLVHVFDRLWVSDTHATSPTGWLADHMVRSWLVVPSCAALGLVQPALQPANV